MFIISRIPSFQYGNFGLCAYICTVLGVPENGDFSERLEPEANEEVAKEVDNEEEVASEVDGQQQQEVPPDQIHSITRFCLRDQKSCEYCRKY